MLPSHYADFSLHLLFTFSHQIIGAYVIILSLNGGKTAMHQWVIGYMSPEMIRTFQLICGMNEEIQSRNPQPYPSPVFEPVWPMKLY